MAHWVCEQQIRWRPLPGPGLLGRAAAQVQNHNSFHLERGSQHGKGDEVCKAAEMDRVRKALSASRGVG